MLKIKFSFAKILVLLLMIIGIFEATLRIEILWDWFALYNYKVADKSIHCYDDKVQAIRLCPNLSQRLDHHLGFSFLVTTDEYGNRITDYSLKNNSDNKKKLIWAIGDSLTMGWGVNDKDSFPFLLSNLGWNVVNLASDSIGSKDVLRILKLILPRSRIHYDDSDTKPKAIVWMFSRSDFQDDSTNKPYRFVFELGKHSKILIMVRSILEKIRLMRDSNDYSYNARGEDFNPPSDNHPTWQALEQIKELAEKEKIEIIIVLAPDWKYRNSPPDYNSEYFKYVKSRFIKLGYQILDMTEDYQKDTRQDFYLLNDGHPSQYAYQKIANLLNLKLKVHKRL